MNTIHSSLRNECSDSHELILRENFVIWDNLALFTTCLFRSNTHYSAIPQCRICKLLFCNAGFPRHQCMLCCQCVIFNEKFKRQYSACILEKPRPISFSHTIEFMFLRGLNLIGLFSLANDCTVLFKTLS